MTILATIWLITKWLFIAATIVVLTLFLLFLFHPLRFDLNLRTTIKGQRGQLWFVYFFRIIKIGVIASPHTQDIILKIFGWKIRLKRFQREKPAKTDSDGGSPDEDSPGFTSETDETRKATDLYENTDLSDKSLKDSQKETENDYNTSVKEDSEPDTKKTSATDEGDKNLAAKYSPEQGKETETQEYVKPSDTQEPDSENENKKAFTSDENVTAGLSDEDENQEEESKAENIETTEVTPIKDKEFNQPVKPLSETDPFADHHKTDSQQPQNLDEKPQKGEKFTVSLRKRLRQLRKKISQKYLQGKKWLKIFLKKYKLFKPIFKKLWKRAKSGFKIKNTAILLKYALHEPYLTGMFQGNLSLFSGVMQRFGIEFIPVPLFCRPTVYSRAKTAAIIKPWRIVLAFISLLFEKVLWQEFYKLFKWYRAQKNEQ
jgi:hypothetical protein